MPGLLHDAHFAEPEVGQAAPVAPLPLWQVHWFVEQEVAPAAEWDPAAHGVQLAEPADALYFPASHAVQDPGLPVCPGPHGGVGAGAGTQVKDCGGTLGPVAEPTRIELPALASAGQMISTVSENLVCVMEVCTTLPLGHLTLQLWPDHRTTPEVQGFVEPAVTGLENVNALQSGAASQHVATLQRLVLPDVAQVAVLSRL